MSAEKLRALQAPFKDRYRYRKDPQAAMLTLRAEGTLDEPATACKIDTGRELIEAGLHRATGGSGLQACSGDILLQALVACAGVTVCAMATTLGATAAGTGAGARRSPTRPAHSAPMGRRRITGTAAMIRSCVQISVATVS